MAVFRNETAQIEQELASATEEKKTIGKPLISDKVFPRTDRRETEPDSEFKKDEASLESANDRISALRQQFMNFRKQSEVMNIKPLDLDIHQIGSEMNFSAKNQNQSLDDNKPEQDTQSNEIRSILQTNFREAVAVGGFPRSRALHENKTATNE